MGSGHVQIVKIPVAWKMMNAEAMFIQDDKKAQAEIATRREAQETEGRRNLKGYLDDGYKIVASHLLDVSTGTFIVYTLYQEGRE